MKVFQHENCTKDIAAKVSLGMNRFTFLLFLQSYPSKDYKFSGPTAKTSMKKLYRWHDFVKLLNVRDFFHVKTQFTPMPVFNQSADGLLCSRKVSNIQFKSSNSNPLEVMWPRTTFWSSKLVQHCNKKFWTNACRSNLKNILLRVRILLNFLDLLCRSYPFPSHWWKKLDARVQKSTTGLKTEGKHKISADDASPSEANTLLLLVSAHIYNHHCILLKGLSEL